MTTAASYTEWSIRDLKMPTAECLLSSRTCKAILFSIVPLDSESNVELNIEYDAWGKPIFEESSLGASFVKAMIMATVNVGYRGYFYDFETGLYYLRSRYYDPEIGRFINADDTDYLGYDDTPLSMKLFTVL